jgi:iron complex outermembrane receptor protein
VLLAFNTQAGITVPRPPMLGGPFFVPGVSPVGVPFPAGIASDVSTDPFINTSSVPLINRSENWGVALSITGRLTENLQVRSITGYRRYTEQVAIDFDASSFPLYDSSNALGQNQLSQELQLSGNFLDERLTFLIGGYYFAEKNFNDVDLCIGSNRPRGATGCLQSINDINLDTESKAAFTNINLKLTDWLEVFGGIRFTRETKNQDYFSVQDNLAGVPTVLPVQSPVPRPGQVRTVLPFTAVKADFNSTTPRIGVNLRPADGILLYGSYAEGFKSGGFTGRPSNATILPYNPETVKTFEVGAKTELLDRRLRLNASAFTSDYKQIQLLVFNTATGLFETDNAGDARIRGFEVEAVTRLNFGDTASLDLNGSLGYLDAKYLSVSPRVQGVSLSDRLPLTSDWTWSASAQLNLPFGESAGELQLRADYAYRSTFSFQIENDPLEIQPGYGLLNLRATYVAPEGRFSVAVFGTNIGDKRYFTGRADTLSGNGVAFGSPAPGREWGVELGFRF